MKSKTFQYILLLFFIICLQSQCEIIEENGRKYCLVENINRNEDHSDNQSVKVCLYTEPELEASLEDDGLTFMHQIGIRVKFLCEVYSDITPTDITWFLRLPRPLSSVPLPRMELNLSNHLHTRSHGFNILKLNETLSQAFFIRSYRSLEEHDIKCTASFGHKAVSIEAAIKHWGIPLEVDTNCLIPEEGYLCDHGITVNEAARLTCRGTYILTDPSGNLIQSEFADNLPIQWIFRHKDEKVFNPEEFGIELKSLGKDRHWFVFSLKHTRKVPDYNIQCKMVYNQTIAAYSSYMKIGFYVEDDLEDIVDLY